MMSKEMRAAIDALAESYDRMCAVTANETRNPTETLAAVASVTHRLFGAFYKKNVGDMIDRHCPGWYYDPKSHTWNYDDPGEVNGGAE